MEQAYPFNPYDWTTITPLFTAIIETPVSTGGFAGWLAQWNDLDIAVNDAWTYVKRLSYTDTANLEPERAYQIYTREMFSTYLGLTNVLIDRALALQPEAPSPAHRQLWRRWQNQNRLFHPQSLPLQAEISELESAYRELTRRIEQMPGNPTAHWMERRTELNVMMLRLLKVRRALAHLSGLPNFLAFRWRELNRLDVSIEEYQLFHRAIEESVIPVLIQLRASGTLDESYPEIADPTLLSDGVERILNHLDPTFGTIFQAMRSGYLDFGLRPGKAVTSEQWFFPRVGMPYLHVASTNLATALHESGHAVHAYLSFQDHPSMWNYAGPDEFQEFAAEAMDMLCWNYYERSQGGFYTAAESAAACRHTLLLYLITLASEVMEDVFEHWVYGEAPDDVMPADLDAKWFELMKRFAPWQVAEMDKVEAMTGWQRWNWSLFRMPLYTIAYPIATVGVCLLGRQVQQDRASAIDNYKAALLRGNTESLPELFRVAGLSSLFTQQAVAEAVQFALEEYRKIAN